MGERFPASTAPQRRIVRCYAFSFILVFVFIFVLLNLASHAALFSTGANRWMSYGWPSAWLRIHTYLALAVENNHSRHDFHFEGMEVTSWNACFASLAICGSIAVAIVTVAALTHRIFRSFVTEAARPPLRALLLAFAALVASAASLLPLSWALDILGTLGTAAPQFPGFLQGAAGITFILITIGAKFLAPHWQFSPVWIGFIASIPYLLLALEGDLSLPGLAIWSVAGFVAFGIFSGITHLRRPA